LCPHQGWVGDPWNRLRRSGVAEGKEVACVPDA
jgi:hypothetical protein